MQNSATRIQRRPIHRHIQPPVLYLRGLGMEAADFVVEQRKPRVVGACGAVGISGELPAFVGMARGALAHADGLRG